MSELETAEIRQLVEHRLEAIRAKDVECSTVMMTADYLLFDVVAPLQSREQARPATGLKNGLLDFEVRLGTRYMIYRSAPAMELVSATV